MIRKGRGDCKDGAGSSSAEDPGPGGSRELAPPDEQTRQRWMEQLEGPRSPHRVRHHGRLQDPLFGAVGFKVYCGRRAGDRLRRRLDRGPGRQEFEITRHLHRSAVAVPRPLGRTRETGPAGRELYFFQWFDGAQDLHQAVLDGSLSLDRRRSLAGELGRQVAQLHDAGVQHRDLHAGNLLLTTEGPVLLDFHRSRRRPWLGRSGRRADLLSLSHFFHRRASLREKLRFLAAYGPPVWPSGRKARRRALAQLSHAAERSLAGFLRHHEKRCLGDGRAFTRVRRGRWRGVAGRSHESRLPEPEPQPQDTAVHSSPRGGVWKRGLEDGGEVVLKRFEDPGLGGLLRCLGRGPRARRAWRNLHRLRLADIDTPQLWAFLAEPWWSRRRRSLLILEWLPLPHLAGLDQPGPEVWDTLGLQIAQLHDDLLRNRDLKAENLLVDATRARVVWIDADGVRRRRRLGAQDVERDLMRLNASFGPRTGPSLRERMRFLRRYLLARRTRSPGPAPQAREICRRTEDKWTRTPPSRP